MGNWVPALRLTGIGFYIVICMLLGTGAGHWLDGKLGTAPWLLVVGLLAGLAIAVYGVYRMIKPLISDNHDNKENS